MELVVSTKDLNKEIKSSGVIKLSNKAERKVVILLIRHGIRYPKVIPKGWPLEAEIVQGEGALTERGAKQSEKLGQRIKDKYFHDGVPFEYEFVSTSSKRTIETARNFAKGLLGMDEVIFSHE
jgi:broad specificity phosphatase PhoE